MFVGGFHPFLAEDFTDEVPQETLVENAHLLQTTKIEQFTYVE